MKGSQAGAARFPGVLLPRGPLRACCYRRGSADAARSRATDPAATRAHPAAILGLRRCTARATQGTWITAFGASTAIASTVSRRGWRRPHHTPMTIPTTVEASLYWGVSVALKKGADRARWRSRRRAAGVGVRAAAGALGPGSRNRPSLLQPLDVLLHVLSRLGRGRRFRAQAPGHQPVASSARPRGQGPPPAPGGPVPGPDSGLGNNGGDRAHPSEHPRGPGLVQNGQGRPQHLGPAVITSHPGHCRPGGACVPSSRAAATLRLPPGGGQGGAGAQLRPHPR